mgnify:CR=1 FL=1
MKHVHMKEYEKKNEGNKKKYEEMCSAKIWKNKKKIKNFRALPAIWAVGLGQITSSPIYMGRRTWKISELSSSYKQLFPIYETWDLKNFGFSPIYEP